MESWILLTVVLLVATSLFWFNWQQAKFEKEELEKAVFQADKKTGVVEKMKPDHYVPSRQMVFPGEKASPYEDCRRYEVLERAKFHGEWKTRSEKARIERDTSARLKKED